MTDPATWPTVAVAVIAAVPATVLALATLISSWKNSRKLDVVHTLTNSNLSSVKVDLSKANDRIASLQATVERLLNEKHGK